MNKISTKSKMCKPKNRMNFHRQVNRLVLRGKQEIDKLLGRIENRINIENDSEQCSQEELIPAVSPRSNALRRWVLDHNVTRRAVNDLLQILREFGMNWLPADSRTLCKTPRSIEFLPVTDGQYWYHGIRTNIYQLFRNLEEDIVLHLNFNVDGVSLFKSSGTEFWPILGNIHSKCINMISSNSQQGNIFFNHTSLFTDFPNISPFVISIWCGKKKPRNIDEFLSPFVSELNHLLQNGINLDNHHICIKIRCFVCDTPARCLLKGNNMFDTHLHSIDF